MQAVGRIVTPTTRARCLSPHASYSCSPSPAPLSSPTSALFHSHNRCDANTGTCSWRATRVCHTRPDPTPHGSDCSNSLMIYPQPPPSQQTCRLKCSLDHRDPAVWSKAAVSYPSLAPSFAQNLPFSDSAAFQVDREPTDRSSPERSPSALRLPYSGEPPPYLECLRWCKSNSLTPSHALFF